MNKFKKIFVCLLGTFLAFSSANLITSNFSKADAVGTSDAPDIHSVYNTPNFVGEERGPNRTVNKRDAHVIPAGGTLEMNTVEAFDGIHGSRFRFFVAAFSSDPGELATYRIYDDGALYAREMAAFGDIGFAEQTNDYLLEREETSGYPNPNFPEYSLSYYFQEVNANEQIKIINNSSTQKLIVWGAGYHIVNTEYDFDCIIPKDTRSKEITLYKNEIVKYDLILADAHTSPYINRVNDAEFFTTSNNQSVATSFGGVMCVYIKGVDVGTATVKVDTPFLVGFDWNQYYYLYLKVKVIEHPKFNEFNDEEEITITGNIDNKDYEMDISEDKTSISFKEFRFGKPKGYEKFVLSRDNEGDVNTFVINYLVGETKVHFPLRLKNDNTITANPNEGKFVSWFIVSNIKNNEDTYTIRSVQNPDLYLKIV